MSPCRAEITSPVEVQAQLDRILRHPLFFRSARLRRFLEFTIGYQFAGRAQELQEYVLGIEVFDRPSAHDPRIDPIVRVEARRLRAKLRAYYESDGADDPVIIHYPRGSYVPEFRLRGTAPAASPVLIAVLPFAAYRNSCARFAEGLTRVLIRELDVSSAVRVLSGKNSGRERARIEALLTGTVRQARGRLLVTAELLSTGSSQNLWSAAFESTPAAALIAQKQIAFATAHALALHFRPAA
ncbi:MAG TPA: hypothetical protein VJ732_15500 [Bryobacteraceae bacterium]|nr:hypothetical protein [Bryobacteraceae bacterium]